MTFAMVIQDFRDQIGFFYQNTHILLKTSHLTSWGAYAWTYNLERRYFFEKLLLCFNFNKTFAMIIQDIRGQIRTFLSKYAYFAENVTFDPPGCLCMDLPPGVMVFFSKNY